jgi:hypothetical protein
MKLTPNKRLELTSAAWRDGVALAAQPRCWADIGALREVNDG